jgi:hypothetical protein
MREAGFSLTAKNPSSGAYGMAQFINGPSEYYQYGGDPNTASGQATAMLNYIAQRYGDPIAAELHEQQYGWYDQGGLLPPGLSLALNQTGSNELVLPNAVVEGFSGGMERLHPFFWNLTSAVSKLTSVTEAAAQASADAAAATAKASAAASKPAPPGKPSTVQLDQKKIADDKANAARLEARIKAVQQAIQDTPAKNKEARKEEEALLKQLQSALKTQNKTTGKDETALAKEIVKENKEIVAAMQKQIAAITKLLGSGSAATSKSNALWGQLVADENKLAAAQKTLAGQVTGKSGGSGGMKVTGTVAVDKGSIAALQDAEVKAYNAAVAKLRTEIAAGGPHSKLAASDLQTLIRRQAAELGQYAKTMADATSKNFSHLMALLHDLVHTANDKGLNELPGTAPLVAALRSAATAEAALAKSLTGKAPSSGGKAPSGGGGGTTVSGSGGYASGVVTDRKAEADLAQLISLARQEMTELKTMVALLGKIKDEAEPAAQAKAIGPAVAQALNSAGRSGANSKPRK